MGKWVCTSRIAIALLKTTNDVQLLTLCWTTIDVAVIDLICVSPVAHRSSLHITRRPATSNDYKIQFILITNYHEILTGHTSINDWCKRQNLYVSSAYVDSFVIHCSSVRHRLVHSSKINCISLMLLCCKKKKEVHQWFKSNVSVENLFFQLVSNVLMLDFVNTLLKYKFIVIQVHNWWLIHFCTMNVI